ncbi:MAG: hypothetical protein PHW24_04205, partial [Candidatus Moranbacteria bacterium]|nr:hypothetical protein [Candidatus Moranbacteria bacterium]
MKSIAKLVVLFLAILIGGVFLLGNFSQAATGINKQINYQGKLTDASGVAVADGNYSMKISLYTVASAGTPIWTARGTTGAPTARTVAVANGIFSIMLGDTVAGDNSISIDFSQDAYYLGITVGADAEMIPRKRIGSVPQAFNANNLIGDGYVKITGTPTGNTVGAGTVYVNPATATAGYTLLGLAVGGTQKFKVDEAGNLVATGNATFSGAGNNTFTGTINSQTISAAANFTGTLAFATLGTTNTSTLLCRNASNQLAACNTIGVTQGGTGTATQFTQGSIVFAGASGVYAQDNANFFWDNTNKRLGIGTAAPSALLTVASGGSDLLTISPVQASFNVPTSFTSVGDISLAYDMIFTNQTASNIKTNSPFTIEVGEPFESNDLTLRTFNAGGIVLDAPGGLTSMQAQTWTLATSTSALNIGNGTINIDTTNGRVGVGTVAPGAKLDVFGTDNKIRLSYDALNYANLSVNSGGTLSIAPTGSGNTAYVDITQSHTIYGFLLHKGAAWGGQGLTGANNDLTISTAATSQDIVFNGQNFGATYETMRIKGTGNVGIGTTTPAGQLELAEAGAPNTMYVSNYSNTLTNNGGLVFRSSNSNTLGTLTTTVTSQNLGAVYFQGVDAGGAFNTGSYIAGVQDGSATASFLPAAISFVTDSVTAGTQAERMRITSDGNVGIGTPNPGNKLDVVGSARVVGGSFYATQATPVNTLVMENLVSGSAKIYTNSTVGLSLGTNSSTTQLVLQNGGNVGINTTAPFTTLQVKDLVANNNNVMTLGTASGILSLTSSANLYGLFMGVKNSNGDAWLQAGRKDGVATAYNILLNPAGGNVGIGTTSPSSLLHVSTVTAGVNNLIRVDNPTVQTFFGVAGAGTALGLGSITNNAALFYTNNIERMRIGATGGLAIGYTSPDAGAGNLLVSGNVGIGTTAPLSKFEVNQDGSTYTYNSLNIAGITGKGINTSDKVNLGLFSSDAPGIDVGGALGLGSRYNTAGAALVTYGMIVGAKENATDANSAGYLALRTRANGAFTTEKMRITSAGNVGINVTTPATALQVKDLISNNNSVMAPGTASGILSLTSSANAYGLFMGVKNDNGDAWLQAGRKDGVATAYNILLNPSGGNVGIGTTAPGARLQVASAGDTVTSYTARFQSSGSIGGAGGILFDQNSTYSYKLHTQGTGTTTGALVFSYINPTTGADINSNVLALYNGNVGIGTTIPGKKMEVGGLTNGAIQFNGSSVRIDSASGIGYNRIWSAGTDMVYDSNGQSQFSYQGVTKLLIDTNGNVGIGTTSPTAQLTLVKADSSALTD